MSLSTSNLGSPSQDSRLVAKRHSEFNTDSCELSRKRNYQKNISVLMKRSMKTGGKSTAPRACMSNVRVLHQVKDKAQHKSGEVHQLSADQV